MARSCGALPIDLLHRPAAFEAEFLGACEIILDTPASSKPSVVELGDRDREPHASTVGRGDSDVMGGWPTSSSATFTPSRRTTGTWSMNALPTTSSASALQGPLRGRDEYLAFIADTDAEAQGLCDEGLDRVTYASDALAFAELSETVEFDGKPMRHPGGARLRARERRRIARVDVFIQTPAGWNLRVGTLESCLLSCPASPAPTTCAHLARRVDTARHHGVPNGCVLELDLLAVPHETGGFDPFAMIASGGRPLVLREAVAAIHRAAEDPRVAGLIARVQIPAAAAGPVQELRDAIAAFSDVKPSLAWAETYPGTLSYYLASAFREVWMQPSGTVGLVGFATNALFLRDALDKAGIEAQFIARGEYKSAANLFTQDRYTDAHREADSRLIESLHSQVWQAVAESRHIWTRRGRRARRQGTAAARRRRHRPLGRPHRLPRRGLRADR